MAIKIIERREPKEKRVRFSCSHCKSKLEAAASDGEYAEDRNQGFYTFKCPVCKAAIYVDSAKF